MEGRLAQGWSPEQISGRLRLEGHPVAGRQWIQRHVHADRKAGSGLWRHLRRRGKRPNRRGGGNGVADVTGDPVPEAFAEPLGRGTAGADGEGIESVLEGAVVERDVHVLGEPADDAVDLGERGTALERHRMGGGHGEEGVENPADPDVLLQDDGGPSGAGGRGAKDVGALSGAE